MNTKTDQIENVSYEGLVFVILLSVALIVTGSLMLYDPELLSFEKICALIGIGLILYGIIKIVVYVLKKSYRSITNYDFTIGLICASMGACALSQASRWGANGISFLGVCILLNAVVMVQYAIQIRFMDGRVFPFALGMAVGVYVFAMLAIIEPAGIFYEHSTLFSALTALSGILGLVSMGMVWIRSRNLSMEEERDSMRMLEDDPEMNSENKTYNNEKMEENESIEEQNTIF